MLLLHMTPENFCYWLKGYFELYGPKTIDEKETRVVWDHLNLVFNKVTPDRKAVGIPFNLEPINYPESLKEWNKNNSTNPRIC